MRGSYVGLAIDGAAWLALLGLKLGGPWALLPTFVLLGLTGGVVGVTALFIERDTGAVFAFVIGLAAPLAMWYWLQSRSPDAL